LTSDESQSNPTDCEEEPQNRHDNPAAHEIRDQTGSKDDRETPGWSTPAFATILDQHEPHQAQPSGEQDRPHRADPDSIAPMLSKELRRLVN
jgi:hypothetical protein